MSRKVFGIILTVIMVLGLTACGGKKEVSPAVGTWEGEFTKFVGDSDDSKKTDEKFTLVLTEDGKGKHNRDGLDLEVTWKLDGENFSMTETFLGMTIDYTGKLSGDTLDIFNGDPSDNFTCEYSYKKSAAAK